MLSRILYNGPHPIWTNVHSDNMKKELLSLGIKVENPTGHLFYIDEYKPLSLNFDLVFIRHGETYGNCGQTTSDGKIDYDLVNAGIKDHDKRIFQGDVDAEINQLNAVGLKQAEKVAEQLNAKFLQKNWEPDLILLSPLTRAKQTAEPFINQFSFEDRCIVDEQIKEISFGAWDNRRVCDFDPLDPCHAFYQSQDALIYQSGINGVGVYKRAENFCDVLLRAHAVLMQLNKEHAGKRILMFSHSMFGAACCILLGKGQKIENGDYLAFDGKRKDGSYYTMPNATPFELNMSQYKQSLKFASN